MSSISGSSNSRDNFIEILRPNSSNRKGVKQAERARKDATAQDNKAIAVKEKVPVSEEPAPTTKQQTDVKLAKRLDDLDSKYSVVSEKLASALSSSGSKAEIEALGSKFDSFADRTSTRFNAIDNKLTNSTGNQLRSAQSRLQSVSSRFGGGQPASGLNLLA